MEKDICEPYRALKDGLKAVQNSEVKIIVFRSKIISDFSVSAERHLGNGEHPEQEQGDRLQGRGAREALRGAGHRQQEVAPPPCCFEVHKNLHILLGS